MRLFPVASPPSRNVDGLCAVSFEEELHRGLDGGVDEPMLVFTSPCDRINPFSIGAFFKLHRHRRWFSGAAHETFLVSASPVDRLPSSHLIDAFVELVWAPPRVAMDFGRRRARAHSRRRVAPCPSTLGSHSLDNPLRSHVVRFVPAQAPTNRTSRLFE